MKKILSILTLTCFVAVNVSLAQDTQTAASKETKTETVKAGAETKSMSGCCKKSTKACCKSDAAMKDCGTKEKAAAKDGEKAEAKKETKSGTN